MSPLTNVASVSHRFINCDILVYCFNLTNFVGQKITSWSGVRNRMCGLGSVDQ
jgi:hypothetical protein